MSWIATTINVLVSVAGASLAIYGQHEQGKAQEEAAEYNAEMRELQAESETERASFEARLRQRQHQREIANGVVSAAGSGLQVDSGSVLDWEGDMVGALGLDLAAIEHNSSMSRYGLLGSAELERSAGRNARTASYYRMGSTALGSASRIAGSWPTE